MPRQIVIVPDRIKFRLRVMPVSRFVLADMSNSKRATRIALAGKAATAQLAFASRRTA